MEGFINRIFCLYFISFFIFLSCKTTPPLLINISLGNFIELSAIMFQLYIEKFSFDLPMEEREKSWLFNNDLTAENGILEKSSCLPISSVFSF